VITYNNEPPSYTIFLFHMNIKAEGAAEWVMGKANGATEQVKGAVQTEGTSYDHHSSSSSCYHYYFHHHHHYIMFTPCQLT